MRRPQRPIRAGTAGFGEHVVPHHCARPMHPTVPDAGNKGIGPVTVHRAWECRCGAFLSLVLTEPDGPGAA